MKPKTITLPDAVCGLAGFISERPLRRCAISGKRLPKALMIRLAADNGAAIPDFRGGKPGRGLWLAADESVLARAACSDGLRFGGSQGRLKPPHNLPDMVKQYLQDEMARLLNLALKSGAAHVPTGAAGEFVLGGNESNSVKIPQYSRILEVINMHNLVPLAIKQDILPALFWPTLAKLSLLLVKQR